MTLWETIHPEPGDFLILKSSSLRPFLPGTPPPSNQPHFSSCGKIYLGASAVRQHTHFTQTPHLTRIYHFYLSKSNPCHLLQNHQVVKPSTPSCKVHVHHMEPTTCNPFYTANKTNGSHKLNNSENTETPPPPRVQRNIAHRSSTLKCLNLP